MPLTSGLLTPNGVQPLHWVWAAMDQDDLCMAAWAGHEPLALTDGTSFSEKACQEVQGPVNGSVWLITKVRFIHDHVWSRDSISAHRKKC